MDIAATSNLDVRNLQSARLLLKTISVLLSAASSRTRLQDEVGHTHTKHFSLITHDAPRITFILSQVLFTNSSIRVHTDVLYVCNPLEKWYSIAMHEGEQRVHAPNPLSLSIRSTILALRHF